MGLNTWGNNLAFNFINLWAMWFQVRKICIISLLQIITHPGGDQSVAHGIRGYLLHLISDIQGARWRSGRASDSELRGSGFDPHKP